MAFDSGQGHPKMEASRRWSRYGMELELRVVLGEEESICVHLPVSDIEGFERL